MLTLINNNFRFEIPLTLFDIILYIILKIINIIKNNLN